MEKTPDNNSLDDSTTGYKNSAQNEFDFELNQIEPITPKKPIKPEGSFFSFKLGRKENTPVPQFNVRKEPTFGSETAGTHIPGASIMPNVSAPNSAVQENTSAKETVAPVVTSAVTTPGFTEGMKNAEREIRNAEPSESVMEPEVPLQPAHIERPIPAVETTQNHATENTSGHNDTAQNYHQSPTPDSDMTQNVTETAAENPIDNNTSPESNDALVAAARAKIRKPEDWQVMQKLPPKHRRLLIALCGLLILLGIFFWLKPDTPTTVEDFQAQNSNALPIEFQPLTPTQEQNQVAENIEDHALTVQDDAQPVSLIGGIVGQAENLSAAIQQMAQTDRTEPTESDSSETTATAQTQNQPQNQTTQPERNRSAAQKIKEMEQRASGGQSAARTPPTRQERPRNVPVTEAKPSRTNDTEGLDGMAESIASGTAKTLTIPAGVSLMQVFRDHNLNIADVNAMTKAAGSGKVLSNFKPGDKVQVVVNKQGRVTVLRLSNGATFTRQSNGTYRYHR